jgi:predicted ATP-grasp superfamily ATP-dependent carboligase
MHFVRTIQRLGSVNANLFMIPVDDSANRLLHSTFDQLGACSYPMPDSASFERLNDKWQFYQCCSQLDVRVPKTVLLGDKSEIDFENLCTAVGLPLVVKPTNKSNNLGVQVICSKDDFRKKILSPKSYNFFPLIAQSFVPGLDIDISALVDRGHIEKFAVQIRKEDAIYFVRNEELVQLAEVVVRELRYTGVIHIDARLHDSSKEVFLIEANPRFWGSLAAATVGGLNFVRAGIYKALGLESSDPPAISDASVPSTRRLLAEIVTFKRSYLRMHPVDRLRLQRAMRVSIRRRLRLPY